MKRQLFIFIIFLSALSVLVAHPSIKYYKVSTTRTVTGTITDIKIEANDKTDGELVVIYLKEKKSDQLYRVEVAPRWFFQLDLLQGSRIEVTGSYNRIDNNHVMLTRSITHNGELHQFRDKLGFPLWRSQRKSFPGKGHRMRHGRRPPRGAH